MTTTYKICLLPGDGIGPEIIAEGRKVLDALGAKFDASFEYTEALLGGIAIDETGEALPEDTLRVAKASDAVLLAAVGGPKWDTTDPNKPRPEQGLLGIRKALTGSLGMLASASLGDGTALYEPSHGSAPDIAGQGIANPLAQILSVEMMLRYSFDMQDAADAVASAVEAVLDEGWRTGDIANSMTPKDRIVGTAVMGDLVVSKL